MNKFLSLIVCFSSSAVFANTQSGNIVYGKDNRVEIYEISPKLQEIAASTAGMISTSKIVDVDSSNKMLPPKALKDSMPLCKGEKFEEQSNSVVCSGFLVGPDLLVTAGHCVKTEEDCKKVSFVFDYKVEKESNKANVVIPVKNIYACKKVIEAKLETDKVNKRLRKDYALIRLDRVVKGRKILSYREAGKIATGDDIYVIGHPVGLPSKYADGAKVLLNDNPNYFTSNLDTFGGNSGSAVFNANSNAIEGILVRGDKDFAKSPEGCYSVNYVGDDNPLLKEKEGTANVFGEEVTRITDISTLLYRNAYLKAISEGNLLLVKDMSTKISEMNIYDNEMNTAILTAVSYNQVEVLKFLLENIKEVNDKNLFGDTALIVAADNNNVEIVNLLLDKGANPRLTDARGKLPYQRAPLFSSSRKLLKRLARK